MASFDTFMPQAPKIDINLFPSSASAGINAGNALPSTATSVVNGIIKGVQTSQSLITNQQQIEINQNTIEQLPIQNAIRQQQLTSAELENQIKELDVQAATSNQDSYLRMKRAEIEAKATAAEQQNQDLKNMDSISELVVSQDPATRKSILLNPEFKGTLIRNPKLFESVLGQLAGDMDEKEKAKAYEALNFSQSRQNQAQMDLMQERYNATLQAKQAKVMEDIQEDGQIQSLMTNSGITTLADLAKITTRETFAGDNKYKAFDASGKEIPNVILNDTANTLLSKLKQQLQVPGLIPAKPQPQTDEASAAEPAKPYADALKADAAQDTPIPNDSITERRRNELTSRPETRARLIEKGLFREPVTPPSEAPVVNRGAAPTPLAAETPQTTGQIPGEPTPQASIPQTSGAPVANEPMKIPMNTGTDRGTTASAVPAPVPGIPEIKQVIDYISPNVKSKGRPEAEVVQRILRDPLIRGLDPLHQAFVAVESGGKANAKNKESTASGYFQFINQTAKNLGIDKSDAKASVQGGVDYINNLKAKYGNNTPPAILAFRLGEPVVDAAIDQYAGLDYDDIMLALRMFKGRGWYNKQLKPVDLGEVDAYVKRIQQYERTFDAVRHRRLTIR